MNWNNINHFILNPYPFEIISDKWSNTDIFDIIGESKNMLRWKKNHKIQKGDIPDNIKIFRILTNYYGHHFEREIIPNSVEYIELYGHYAYPIDIGVIPNSVTKIKTEYMPENKTDIWIPDSVEIMILGRNGYQKGRDDFSDVVSVYSNIGPKSVINSI